MTSSVSPAEAPTATPYDRLGRLITCEHGERRVSLTTKDGVVDFATEYEGMRLNSPNDVISLANGDVIFTDPTFGLRRPDGTVHGQQLPFAGLYRVSAADSSIRLLADDFAAPNGLAVSDESKIWISDTTNGHIRLFDIGEDGALRNGKVFAELKQEGIIGRPGGIKLDSQGNLFVAGNTDDGVWVYSAGGRAPGLHPRRRGAGQLRLGRRRLEDPLRCRTYFHLSCSRKSPRSAGRNQRRC